MTVELSDKETIVDECPAYDCGHYFELQEIPSEFISG